REGYDMFTAMLDGMKEESVGFLFNVTVEAVPAPQVAPLETPEGLAELAAQEGAAAATGQQGGTGGTATAVREEAPSTLRAKGIDSEEPALTYSGPAEDGSAQVQHNGGDAQKTPAGVPAGASRRERREAARRQGRGPKPPKSAKRR
ncbi:MAG: preprotein translocase subunit SecA, partial [Mycobacterium sp.]